jgi:hypothetical protein
MPNHPVDSVAPLDQTHAQCVAARELIRHQFALLTARVAVWEPAEMPADWRPQ